MSRRRSSADDSLELLLDTICNTFGGVLFLAMLVSLLLTQTSHNTDATAAQSRPAVSAADVSRLDARAAAAAEEVTRLQGLKQRLQQLQTRLTADRADESMLTELGELEAQAVAAGAGCAQALATAALDQAAAARARQSVAQRDKRKRQLEVELATVRKRLDEVRRDGQQLALTAAEVANAPTIETAGSAPRERTTTKREFGVMLKFGRMYLMHRHTATTRTVNDEEFFISSGLAVNQARPKPTRGVDLLGDDVPARVADRLRSYPSDGWYVCLVVNPDSFEVFPLLKNWLVAHGYEYRVMPTSEPVIDQGSSDNRVQ